jgi:hypothetical protein
MRKFRIRVVRGFVKHTSASDVRVLPRRAIPGGIHQSWPCLIAIKAHVSQLPIAETAQDGQGRLVFAPSDESRHPSIDETEKPSADGAKRLRT